jgi:hypothetical protein
MQVVVGESDLARAKGVAEILYNSRRVFCSVPRYGSLWLQFELVGTEQAARWLICEISQGDSPHLIGHRRTCYGEHHADSLVHENLHHEHALHYRVR